MQTRRQIFSDPRAKRSVLKNKATSFRPVRKSSERLTAFGKTGISFVCKILTGVSKDITQPIFLKPLRSRRRRRSRVCLILWLFSFSFPASAKIIINIGSAKVKKSVIALAPFVLKNNSAVREELEVGEAMFSYLNENLKFSGYFKILSPEAFIEDPVKHSALPQTEDPRGFRWENWRLAGADFLLFNNYTLMEGKVQLKASFYDINLKRIVFKRKYTVSTRHTEQLINRLSNDIVERLSGRKGIFETRITAVANPRQRTKRAFYNELEPGNIPAD